MSQLEDLLQHCTVKLSLSNRVGWGTGFFVAPGWILTCAHVIQAAQGQPIQVRWQNQENWAEAVVERAIPDPYDLALLRVTLPTDANPPCVLLGEEVRSRDPLYLFGYPDEDFPNGCPVTLACEGLTGDTPPLIKFALGQVRPGMSGAPLLNQRTGEVCGSVKFTRDRSFDLGGGAISAAVILEQFPQLRQLQQQFHQLDQRWSNLLPTATNQSKILDDQKVRQYLDYLSRSEWWNSYRLTEAISAQQATFTFEQMVQTEEQSQENPAQKEKRVWALLEGIIHYVKSEPVLLVGAPGLGKSTTLLRLLVDLARQELRITNPRIPVLIRLKDYANSARETGDSSGILALIQEALKPDLFLEITAIETLLFQKNCFILLLDGLNEIPANVIQNKLTTFRQQCDRAGVPLVCTTRNLGFDLGIQRKLQLQTLEPSEIQRFLQHCMPGQEHQVLNLLNKSNPELGKTPFVLWMLYDVFKKSGEIPESIGEAFRKFKRSYTNYKLNQEGIPVSEEMIDSWNLWLEYLAFEMLRSPDPHDPGLIISEGQAAKFLTQFPITPALDLKQAQAEIKNLLKYHLLQTNRCEISFCHHIIQEYYAAEFLLRQLPELINEPLKLKREYLNYLKWTEAIALMLTLVKEELQAQRVVKLALEVDLLLGARLAGAASPQFHKKTVELTNQLIDSRNLPEWLRVELWGRTRSKEVLPSLLQALNSQDINVTRIAANFVGQTSDQAVIDFLVNRLKEIDSVFFAQLSFRDNDPTAVTWMAHIEALAYIAPQKAIIFLRSKLLADRRSGNVLIWTVTQAPSLLMKLDGQACLELLIHELRNPEIQSDKNYLFNLVGAADRNSLEPFVPQLVEILEQEQNVSIQIRLIELLGKSTSELVTQTLINFVAHPDSKLRDEVKKRLINRRIEDQSRLEQLLTHENSDIARTAAFTLGSLGNTSALPTLAEAVKLGMTSAKPNLSIEKDNWAHIRLMATQALGCVNHEEAISHLLIVLRSDDNSDVRREAAFSLSNFGRRESIPELLIALNKSYFSRIQAIRCLAKLNVKEPLWNIVQLTEEGWQTAAVELGKLGRAAVLPYLRQALIDAGQESTNEVIKILSELADHDTCNWLVEALENPGQYRADRYFSNRVALVLVGCHPEIAASKLRVLQNIATRNYIEQIAWVIPTIQSRYKFYNHEVAQGLIPSGKTVAIYFSYASNDELLQNELVKHLDVLKRQDAITSWDHRKILPGEEREQVINDRLNTADIILLLISPDSVADDHCYEVEIRRAIARHQAGEAHVIPILLRPVNLTGELLGNIPVLPKNGVAVTLWDNQDEAFRAIAAEIQEVAIRISTTKS
ncbi:MAG: HEAT repeat domain-containing protein [Leptolyngbya sp. UWPOB_LEPTO1]|uniref:HEAT repeat domain-containing protein n=1 Tax=Leptolyngbya sp. UWPOB_LEPTO1 TaxID=2815653 RepID=UPI001AD12552|nr:trypsin-like peptidase domain-containing protein [Leptolyngbya sp. UWPOB_LEPTO1]MBN8564818.1 HEAT repeat domain-containing protein [Leptolyngbya sp. UWPOB_LEPTO1]